MMSGPVSNFGIILGSFIFYDIILGTIYETYVNDAFMNTYTPSSNHNEIVLIFVKLGGLLSVMVSYFKAVVIQIK